MSIRNTKDAYGWASIVLHWVSAAAMLLLWFQGEGIEDAVDRAQKMATENTHVAIGGLAFVVLAGRIVWHALQPQPTPLETRPPFRIAAAAVKGLLMLLIAVLLITGVIAVWSIGRPLGVYGIGDIPSPFTGRNRELHEIAEQIHGLAVNAFWPLLILHVGGALKHLVIDKDQTMQRMLRVRRPSA